MKAGLKVGPHERPAHTSQMTVPSELPMNQKQWKDFIKSDDDLEVVHALEEDDIMEMVLARHKEKDEEEDKGPISSVTETRNALHTLKRGLLG